MKNIILTIGLCGLAALMACSPKPQDINYGEDACAYCKMTIVDRQHAAEAVTQKGRVYKFDAVECLLQHVEDAEEGEAAFAHLLVNDFFEPGQLIEAQSSHYLISPEVPSPMGAFLSGFQDEAAAERLQAEKGGQTFTWPELLIHARKEGLVNY